MPGAFRVTGFQNGPYAWNNPTTATFFTGNAQLGIIKGNRFRGYPATIIRTSDRYVPELTPRFIPPTRRQMMSGKFYGILQGPRPP